jgi:D-glycero-alpha-D-manno-heptose 1-phosphate guanylyltransferase
MIREAIVLAGGLGTRLKSAVPDLPKCLAPVAGKPFLEYLIRDGEKQGIQRFIFALGYKTELVENFVRNLLPETAYLFSVEREPLGTGGAIRLACSQVSGTDALVMNADTFFAVNLRLLADFHEEHQADCTLSLKPMKQFDRYGAVNQNAQQLITGFSEKKYMESGLINGGIYALNTECFLKKNFPPVFSLEKDYLEKEYRNGRIYGLVSDAYFIDIGIPEDYRRAQTELIQHIS